MIPFICFKHLIKIAEEAQAQVLDLIPKKSMSRFKEKLVIHGMPST